MRFLALAVSAASCRTPATSVQVIVDTDAPAERHVTLRVLAINGAVQPQDLEGLTRQRGLLDRVFGGDGMDGGGLHFPVSFAVVPQAGVAEQSTVWLRASIGARGSAPAVELDRVIRFRFVPRSQAVARVFLPLRCTDRAIGCATVPSEQCSVSVRCREQGATCGDLGECVLPEVELTLPDAGEPPDAAMPSLDVTSGRADAVGLDDTVADTMFDVPQSSDTFDATNDANRADAAADDGVTDRDGRAAPDVYVPLPAPRPVFPLSGGAVSTRTPQLRWVRPANVPEGYATLCRDRACTQVIASIAGVDTAVLPENLPDGWIYWSVRAKQGVALGLASSATWQFYVHPSPGGIINSSWSAPLDVNGDRYADVAVAAPGAAAGGRVTVYLGGPMGLSAAQWVVNSPANGQRFGASVANAGDVNGDGFSDLVVGDPQASPGANMAAGRVVVYYGGAIGFEASPLVLDGGFAGTEFGNSVASAGDVNGDGYGDVIVGWHRSTQFGQLNAGSVLIYFGSAMGLGTRAEVNFTSFIPGEDMGYRVAGAGDINRDGYADVLVSIYNATVGAFSAAGRVGYAFGDADPRQVSFDGVLDGRQPGGRFGGAISSVGDFNGDQFSDFAIGAPLFDMGGTDVGAVDLVLGGPMGPQLGGRVQTIVGTLDGERLGSSLALAGDTNGDGYSDLAIGAPGALTAMAIRAGNFAVYFGNDSGNLLTIRRGTFTSRADEQLGSALAGGGDIDNNGLCELAVGAPLSTRGGPAGSGWLNVFGYQPVPMPMLQSVAMRTGTVDNEALGFAVGM